MLKLLQVCNVGNIVGGTAACAWSVTKAFPDCEHHLLFFGEITNETRTAFLHCRIETVSKLDENIVRRINPDLGILHNTPRSRLEKRLPCATIQYLHSRITPESSDITVACSDWLAKQYTNPPDVCLQGVPCPSTPEETEARFQKQELTIGRICTPQSRKWPKELIAFYSRLSEEHPTVNWEFIGCPNAMQQELRRACKNRTTFRPAGWQSRENLWRWDAMLYHHPHLAESFGRTVAEAMRAGCIPIVDNKGGFREQIVEGTGFLCGSQEEFLQAVSNLKSPEVRCVRSQHCRKHADELFSLKAFRHRLLDVLELLLGKVVQAAPSPSGRGLG